MKFYFTFGSGQFHEGRYCVIEAKDSNEAREMMFDDFSDKWSAMYTKEQWTLRNGKTHAEEYNLIELIKGRVNN